MHSYIRENYTMLFDFYELTMGNGYFLSGLKDKISYFDVFYRQNPDNGGYAIACGLEQIVDYINNLRFTEEDIEYLRSKKCFDEKFLDYLRTFRFTGDIYAMPEGTPIFPGEPVITVRASAIEAQFIETFLLLTFNHQSLIATKANRIVRAANGRAISEFGSRRAQGPAVPYSVQEHPISQAAQEPRARSPTNGSEFRRPEQWLIHGSLCSIPSTKPSTHTAGSTRPQAPSLSIPTMSFQAAFPTQ